MILKYKDFKMLSKDDMKHIMGGSAPDSPPGFAPEVGGEVCACQCCWIEYPNSCSSCVLTNYPGAQCVSGAFLRLCGGVCNG